MLKHDLKTGAPSRHRRAGPRTRRVRLRASSTDAAEDDGVAMGFVYDRSTDRSDLVLLDAQTLGTVATVHLPARVPHGFHGNWVPSDGLGPSEARDIAEWNTTARRLTALG